MSLAKCFTSDERTEMIIFCIILGNNCRLVLGMGHDDYEVRVRRLYVKTFVAGFYV